MKDIIKKTFWYVILIGMITYAFTFIGATATSVFTNGFLRAEEITIGSYTTTMYILNIKAYLRNVQDTLNYDINAFKMMIEFPDLLSWVKQMKIKEWDDVLQLLPYLFTNVLQALANLMLWFINLFLAITRLMLLPINMWISILGLAGSKNPIIEFIQTWSQLYAPYQYPYMIP